MKMCLRLEVEPSGEGVRKVLDLSLVDDAHVFGYDADGYYHVEGSIQPSDRRQHEGGDRDARQGGR